MKAREFVIEMSDTESFSIDTEDGHKIPSILTENNNQHLLIMSHGITTEKTETGLYSEFSKKCFI